MRLVVWSLLCWIGEVLALLVMAAVSAHGPSAFGMIFALLALMPLAMAIVPRLVRHLPGGAAWPGSFLDVIALSQFSAILSWLYLMLLIRLVIPIGMVLDRLTVSLRPI